VQPSFLIAKFAPSNPPLFLLGYISYNIAKDKINVAISTYGSKESYQSDGFNRFTLQEILRRQLGQYNEKDTGHIDL
jgi:hypothetical protein